MISQATPSNEEPVLRHEFTFLSGRLCLAFAATLYRRRTEATELLDSPAALARWYVEAGLLDAPVAVSHRELARAVDLREAIHRGALRTMAGEVPEPADEERFNSAASRPPMVPQLHGGTVRLTPPGGNDPAAALSTVARDAIGLLTSPDVERMRECAREECTLLFVDLSRPGRRRWCSSTRCGGRARAADYRRRRREETGTT